MSLLPLPLAFADDMMYTQGHKPTASAMQADEIAYQVRRLAHHPSIAVWDACSEWRKF